MPVIVADAFRRIKLYDNRQIINQGTPEEQEIVDQYEVVADDRRDTLTLEAGDGISLIVNPANDSIVIYNTGLPLNPNAGLNEILQFGNSSPADMAVGRLDVDNIVINNNTITSDINVNMVLKVQGNGTVVIDGATALQLPVGTTAQRPGTTVGTAAIGQIRFNYDEVRFEGYDGRGWNTLGGVSSIDGGTVIAPDPDQPILNFRANGQLVATMSSLNAQFFAPGFVIPTGTTAERPIPIVGQIRFNTQNTQFEGYNGQGWASLGGVRDIDGNTYILPELDAGTNENTLYFVTNNNLAMTIDGSRISLENGRVLSFREGIAGGSSTASISPPDNVTESYTIKLPSSLGGEGNILSIDATGQLEFINSDANSGSKITVSELYGNDNNDGFNRPVRTLKRALQIASGYVYSPTFVYDEAVCRRDAGLIIDSLGWDLVTGSNWRSIKAGQTYYNATASTVITSQKAQTVSAVSFLKNKVLDLTTDNESATTTLTDLSNEIIDILNNGVEASNTIVMPAPAGADIGFDRAKNLLLANRDFLVAETIAWINRQISLGAAPFDKGVDYDETLCRRDTGIILDAVGYDLALGTNYNTVTSGLAYQRVSANLVTASQKTVTVEALQYIKGVVLALPDVAADSTAVLRVTASFDEIIDIIENGSQGTSNSADPLLFPTPTGGAAVKTYAKELLVANREFFRAEIIAWLNINYPSVIFNRTTCSRDVGYLVDALCYDILYGGDSASLHAAESYFLGSGAQVLPQGQRAATVAAFNRLSAIAQQVILKQPVVVTIGNTISQDTDSAAGPASAAEASRIADLTLYITAAIAGNTVNDLPSPTYPSITWASAGLQAARTSIVNARQSIIDGTINYINTANPFIYDSTKCARDTAFIVNSVAYDLIYNSNSQSVDAGLKYFSGVNNSIVIAGQATQTAAAIEKLRTVAVQVIQSIPVTVTEGNTEIQITSTDPFNSSAVSTASGLFSTISSIISLGVTNAPQITEPAITIDPALAAIKTKLTNARARIADNVVAYSSDYKPNGKKIVVSVSAGNYIEDNPVIIPDNTSVLGASLRACDIRPFNANQDMFRLRNAAYFGEFTFRDYVDQNGIPTHTWDYATVFDDPTDINCSRIGYTNMPISKPVIFVSPYIQNVSILSFLGGNGAKVDGNLVETPNIPDVKQLVEYPLSGPTPEQGKSFVANAYTMLSFGGTGWRLLNDAYAQIVSCFQIFMLNGSYAQSGGYLSVTNSATNFGIYALRASGYSPNAFEFDKGYIATTGTSNSKQTITALGFGRAPNQDYVIRFRSPDYKLAYDLLLANKQSIQQATIDWISVQVANGTYPFSNGFTYDQAKCSRDVGLIIDALGYDLMFGSNFQSVKAAMSYYRANAADVVGVQKQATLDALAYLKTQVAAAAAGTSVAVARVNANMNNIIDIVDNGLGAVPPFVIPDPAGFDAGLYNARRLLVANRAFIIAETTAWIAVQKAGNISPFTSAFTYNIPACERDVGYLVDAIRYDLTYGGNLQALVFASAYYVGTQSQFGTGEKEETIALYQYVKSIIGNILTGTAFTKSSGNALNQDTSGTGGSSAAGTFAESRIQEVIDTLVADDGTIPATIEPSLSWVATSLIGAKSRLQTQKSTIRTNVISYINVNYPPTPFQYNDGVCYRDVGLIIDAVAYDVFTGGNARSIEAGRSYYAGTTSANVVVNGQLEETVAAVNYAKSLALSVTAPTGIDSYVGTKFDLVTGAMVDPGNAPESVAYSNVGDITNNYKPASVTVSFDAATKVNVLQDTIEIPLHGFINGQAIIYDNGGNPSIAGLDDEQTYYVYYVDTNFIKLTFDEAGTVPVNIRSVSTGTHLFYKNLQEFYVDDVIESHNSFQQLTLQAPPINGAYTFTPGKQITGVTGATTNNAYVYSWDPVGRKLVVALNKVTVGASIIRNAFAANSTIDVDNGSPALNYNIVVTEVQAINTLYAGTFSIQSTATGGLLTNLANLDYKQIWLHRPSIVNSSGHTWEYAGSGIDYNALPQNGGKSIYKYEQYSDLPGRVYSSGTNELGDFKVGDFIKAENKTGNVSFTNKVSVAQLDALRLAVGDIVIEFISSDPDLGDNEPGGASDSRLTTQKAIRSFMSNRLGGFIDKAVSTNAVPGAVIQLNSSGQINPDLLPAVRTFNSAKSKGFFSRLSLVEEVPAYDFLNGDIVTEEYSTVQLTISAPITYPLGSIVTQAVTGATGYLIGDVTNETVITVASAAANFTANFNTTNNLTIGGDSTPSTTNTTVKPNLVGTVATNVPANFVLSNANEGQYLNLLPSQSYSFTVGSYLTSANDNVQGIVISTRYGVLDTVDNAGITPGTGYTPTTGTMTYTNVSLTNVTGTGTGGIADITVTNGSVTSVDLRRGGTGYAVGNKLSAAVGTIGGTGSGFEIPVTGIEQRVYMSLVGGERFVATLASPNFVADNNAPVQAIAATGSSTKTFNAAAIGGNVDYTNSRITINSHTYANGDPVKYVSAPNTAIGGLSNDDVVYVGVYDANTIELYNDYKLIDKVAFTSSSSGTHSLTIYNFNLVDKSVYYAGHPYNTGDPIRMTGSNLPQVGTTNIVTGSFFFAGSVTTNSFTLHTSRSAALQSINGLVIDKTEFVTQGTGTITLTKQNVIVQGTVNTSSTNSANWSPLSATTIDASSITGGVISTSRLASQGTANSTTYLRGDSVWHTAVQSIYEDASPITLTGSFTTTNSKNYYYGDIQIDIERVDSASGDELYTNAGVAKFRKSQFNVGTNLAKGEVFIKDGVVDAGTLDSLDSAYFLNPANLTSNVPVTRGGTNLSSYATGDMLYASGSAILNKVAIGGANYILTSDGTKPVWSSSLNLPGSLTVTNVIESTSPTSGTLVVSGGVGIEKNVYVGGNMNVGYDLTVQGNVIVKGSISTINSTTVSVDDKNIELGSVASISGLSGTISGTTIAGLLDTSSLIAGMKLQKVTGVGAFGTNPVINTIVNGTTITITSDSVNTDGTITFDVLGATNATADGGGITLKGTTDKTLNWINATSAWTSSEHFNLSAGKEYRIGGVKVMDATSLGNGIVSIGTITTGTWNASIVAGQYGGTGVNNSGKTITLGGNLTTSGAFNSTFTMTADTAVTFPTTGTLATRLGTETLANKTLTTPKINDVSSTHTYDFAVSELTANRTITLPLLVSNDTFVFNDHAQTLSNKTLTLPKINDTSSNNTYNFAVSELTANRTITLPLLLSDDTFVFNNHTQTLTNKTLTTPKFSDSAGNNTYNLAVSDIDADRTITLPALTGNDTFVFESQAQTLTNKSFSDANTFFIDEADNLKKMQFQLSGITSNVTRTLTVPNNSGTIALTSDIGNSTLTLNVSGVGLSGSQTFTANSFTDKTFTVTSNATSANTASTIVARDANGDFNARYINASYFNSSDDVSTGTVSYVIGKFGDNYHRSVTAAKLADFLSGQTLNVAGNADTATKVVATVTGTNSAELVRGNMADNDQFRILVGATASNSGYAEIATADDGTEPIYVRQYTGVFTTLSRTATLLDASGNTTFPGTVTAASFTGKASDSNLLDGLDLHTGRNNEANKVVRTDASGYIQAGWINTTSGDNGTTAIDRVYASSDGYIRYYTPTNFRQVLDVPTRTGGNASGTWGINITGTAPASGLTGQTGMWTSATRPGPYRLYRRDDDSNYSVQTYWTGTYWRLYGYNGDTAHADTHVGYADNAGYATSAGNADTVDSLHVHTGRNNSANQIVRTDANGYIQCGYINSSNGDEGNNSNPTRVWGTNGSDSYLRTYLTSALSVNYAASAGSASSATNATYGRYVYDNGGVSGTAAWREASAMYVTYASSAGSASSASYASYADEATNNYFYVRGNSPSVLLVDNDQGQTRYLHHNSGLIGFLSAAGGWTMNVNDSGTVSATLFSGTATSARYADLAENYLADAKYEEGTVLVLGGDKEVTISTTTHAPEVVGVVSTNPAHLMNSELTGEFVVAVALTGRVPCKVTGKIKKGDRLVASSIPGLACAYDKALYEPGCIIGKAMEDFDGESGVIEIVVGRV